MTKKEAQFVVVNELLVWIEGRENDPEYATVFEAIEVLND